MKFFVYDNVKNEIAIENESIFLIRELGSLLEETRNKCDKDKTGKKKLRAFKELTYIFLFFD